MTVTRPVLRYHGGKFGNKGSFADWIIGHFPPHRIYTEVYGGAASVLMRKPRSYAEVYNDLFDDVVTVFRVLRDPDWAAELERLIRLTPYARAEFKSVSQGLESVDCDIERARRMIFRSFSGFGSASFRLEYSTGFRCTSHRSGTTPAHDWAHYPDAIATFTSRLQGVTIECRPAIDVLRAHDSGETLHYVDPPYVHATRNVRERNLTYAHEMTDAQHVELAAVLGDLKGAVVLSGYRCDLYDSLYAGWRRIDKASFADGARKRTESLWLNEAALRGQCLFGGAA